MKIKIISIITLIIFLATFIQANTNKNQSQIQYFLPEVKKWSRDLEVDADISGPKHFYFSETEDIDLNVVPVDDDIATSLNSRGADQFIEDILSGKNYVNDMLGAGKIEVLSYNLTKAKDHQILEINSRQLLSDGMTESVERFYIYPSRSIHTQLNWRKSSDPKKVKEAKSLFAQFKVQSLAGPSK